MSEIWVESDFPRAFAESSPSCAFHLLALPELQIVDIHQGKPAIPAYSSIEHDHIMPELGLLLVASCSRGSGSMANEDLLPMSNRFGPGELDHVPVPEQGILRAVLRSLMQEA